MFPADLRLVIGCLLLAGCNPLARPSLTPYAFMQAQTADPRSLPQVRFLGTTTLVFGDGKSNFMIDGFVTRPKLGDVLFSHLEPNEAIVDAALSEANVDKLGAVLVAHSHYDHVLDAPMIAAKTNAILMGSSSTANIGRGAGLPDPQIRVLSDRQRIPIGSFIITAFSTPHSPRALFRGSVKRPMRWPATASRFREGGNFSFLVEHPDLDILVVPSANFSPGKLAGLHADVVFLSIGTLGNRSCGFARNYWHETVQASGARLVIPIHWDDFTRPLDQPLVPMLRGSDNFERAMRIVRSFADRDHVTVRMPGTFSPVDFGGVSKAPPAYSLASANGQPLRTAPPPGECL